MRFVLGLALLVGTVCVGQQPKQLTCPKYEHVEFDEEMDTIAIPESRHPYHKVPGSERCAPDLHVVTEKEFQELLARLKVLERTAMICAKQADGSFNCESVEYRESHPKIEVDVKQ